MKKKTLRLAGPHTHICWTPDGTPKHKRFLVSLVKEDDLLELLIEREQLKYLRLLLTNIGD